MDLASLKDLDLNDIITKLKSGALADKKTLIKFGVGFGAILIFLIGYYAFVSPIVKQQEEQIFIMNENKIKIEEFKNNIQFSKLAKKRREMQRALDLGKLVNSNQARSYRSLAQVTRSVPQRVQFTKMTFDGNDSLIIEGVAFSDQDILNFISNLNAKSLIEQASLAAMQNQTEDQNSGSNNKKGFIINCKLKLA